MPRVIWHQSGVNQNGEPFVQILLDDEPVSQFSPQEAREFALVFMEAAEAAEQDAFMFDFMQTKVGLDINRTMQVIVDFRKWREEHGKKGPPANPKDFMVTDKHKRPEAGK